MYKLNVLCKTKTKPRGSYLYVVVGFFFASIGEKFGWSRYGTGYLVGLTLAMLVEYWIPPRPPMTFHLWSLKVMYLVIGVVYGYWFVPKWISGWVWTPFAYGMPSFVILMSFYLVYPLYPVKKKVRFVNWMLISLMASICYGTIMFIYLIDKI